MFFICSLRSLYCIIIFKGKVIKMLKVWCIKRELARILTYFLKNTFLALKYLRKKIGLRGGSDIKSVPYSCMGLASVPNTTLDTHISSSQNPTSYLDPANICMHTWHSHIQMDTHTQTYINKNLLKIKT